MVHKENL